MPLRSPRKMPNRDVKRGTLWRDLSTRLQWDCRNGLPTAESVLAMKQPTGKKRDFKQFLMGEGPSFEGLDLTRDDAPPRRVKL